MQSYSAYSFLLTVSISSEPYRIIKLLSRHRTDGRLQPVDHLALGRALAPLGREGLLVLGSGNIVHNLRHALMSQARATKQHDTEFLVHALMSENVQAHPTPDYCLPLLYAAGAANGHAAVRFFITGFDLGSLSNKRGRGRLSVGLLRAKPSASKGRKGACPFRAILLRNRRGLGGVSSWSGCSKC